MFLSRVEMAWEAARNPYDLHRQLWRLFPGEARESRINDEQPRQGFLFRSEDYRAGRPARLLVQSRKLPQPVPGIELLGTREFKPQPTIGQRLAFLLTANPIKTIKDAERQLKPAKKSETCRVPLIREDDRREWLARKLAGAAEVEQVSVLSHAPVYFRKGKRAGKLVTATYEGVLRVFDPAAFVLRLQDGIGPAKGFGCGLMLVRRI